MSTALRNVLVIGAGGFNIGHHVTLALLSDPTFTVSVLVRNSSTSTYPSGCKIVKISDDPDKSELVTAFRGQDAIICARNFKHKATEKDAIDAAIEAGVKRFIPSEYGLNNTNPAARALSPVFDIKGHHIEYLKSKESTGLTWTAVATGLWLDWALDPSFVSFMQINIHAHTAMLFNNGTHKTSFSTLPTAADCVRRVLLNSHDTANQVITFRDFNASAHDVLEELQRLQGVKYEISQFDALASREGYWEKWRESGGTNYEAATGLTRTGFLCDGFGSDFEGEVYGRTELANERLGYKSEVTLEEVVRSVLERYP